MTNLFSAICDDYRLYVAYCKAKEIRLQKEENFYETEEWKDIEKIPASKLKKILEKN